MKTTCLEPTTASNRPAVAATEPLAVLAARAACALECSMQRLVMASDQNLGHLEAQAAYDVQELLRQALQRGAQAKADATPPTCPVCGQPLSRLSGGHARTFQSRHGEITVQRTRGYCKRCRKWRTPADFALGLEESAGYSPAVQDMAALLASKMPLEEASAVLEHLTGVKLPRATLDREAKRQGQRAQRLRTELDQQATTQKTQLELTLEPYQMIIQLDAWNIRERDDWGKSAALRRRGQEPERWHWVYTGTCFRLDHRGRTAGGGPPRHRPTRFGRHPPGHRGLAHPAPCRSPATGPRAGGWRPGHCRRRGVDLASGRRSLAPCASAVGLLSR